MSKRKGDELPNEPHESRGYYIGLRSAVNKEVGRQYQEAKRKGEIPENLGDARRPFDWYQKNHGARIYHEVSLTYTNAPGPSTSESEQLPGEHSDSRNDGDELSGDEIFGEPDPHSENVISFADIDDLFNSYSTLQPESSMDQNMDVDTIGVTESEGVRAPARGTGTGGSSGIINFPLSSQAGNGSLQFTKTRTMYTYAYAGARLKGDGKNKSMDVNERYYTTCLGYIPVDYLPFYMDISEFTMLQKQPYLIEEVGCSIKILGVRSAFETSKSTSGMATAEYVPLLNTIVGMNKIYNITNGKYSSDATKPMVPNNMTYYEPYTDFTKWYGETDETDDKYNLNSSYTCVPRSVGGYACTYCNSTSYAGASDFDSRQIGTPRLDKYVKQHLLTSTIGETVVVYKYKPKYALLNTVITPYYPWNIANRKKAYMRNVPYLTADFGLSGYSKTNIGTQIGDIIYKNQLKSNYVCSNRAEYNRSIEGTGIIYNPYKDSIMNSNNIQPQVHIGLQAIPQLNPSTETTDFLTASMYFECSTYIKLRAHQTQYKSLYSNEIIPREEEQLLFDSYCGHSYGLETTRHVFGRPIPLPNEGFGNVDTASQYEKRPLFKQLYDQRKKDVNMEDAEELQRTLQEYVKL